MSIYDDVLNNINGAIMLLGEARKGRFGFEMDIVYTDIEMEDSTPLGILYSALNSRTKSWMVSGAGLYRLLEAQNRFLDFIVGVRYWSVDSELTLKGPLFPFLSERSLSNKEDWVDPIIGLKGFMPIGLRGLQAKAAEFRYILETVIRFVIDSALYHGTLEKDADTSFELVMPDLLSTTADGVRALGEQLTAVSSAIAAKTISPALGRVATQKLFVSAGIATEDAFKAADDALPEAAPAVPAPPPPQEEPAPLP